MREDERALAVALLLVGTIGVITMSPRASEWTLALGLLIAGLWSALRARAGSESP